MSENMRLEFIINRLDSLLLSLLSILSIVYAVLNTALHGDLIFFYFIPITILYGVPLWIGYIRGAITLDYRLERLEERIKGWVYLIGGTIGYIAHYVVLRIFEVYLLPHPNLMVKIFLFVGVIAIVIGTLYLSLFKWGFPGIFLHEEIYQHLKLKTPPYDTETIVKLTNRNALLLGVWLYSFSLLLAKYKKPLWLGILIVLFLFALCIAILLGEIKIRERVNTAIKQ